MAQKRKDKSKKRVVNVEAIGQAHIKASFNNIIISMTNTAGQVISWASAGKMGFKGSKKNTPYAAQVAAQEYGGAVQQVTTLLTCVFQIGQKLPEGAQQFQFDCPQLIDLVGVLAVVRQVVVSQTDTLDGRHQTRAEK